MKRTAREEELQIEVERLKAWLGFIANESWKRDDDLRRDDFIATEQPNIAGLARDAIAHSSWP